MSGTRRRAGLAAAALMLGSGLAMVTAPVGGAICGSIGGPRIDVSGCADPLYEMNYAPPPPPPPGAPPPPAYVPPPPPPLPNVNVCANVGRRINVSGCI